MKSLNNYTARVQAAIIALFLIIAIFSALSGNAQATIKQTSDGNYIAVKNEKTDSIAVIETGRIFTDLNGIQHKVYQSKKGKLFIFRTSRNNIVYKYYLKID